MVHQIKPGEPTSKISEDDISWTTGNISPLSENRLILAARWQRRLVDLAQLYTSCVHWLTTVLDKTPSQPWSHTHHIFWSNTPPYFNYTSFILHKGFDSPYDSYLFVWCWMISTFFFSLYPLVPQPTGPGVLFDGPQAALQFPIDHRKGLLPHGRCSVVQLLAGTG